MFIAQATMVTIVNYYRNMLIVQAIVLNFIKYLGNLAVPLEQMIEEHNLALPWELRDRGAQLGSAHGATW
jgi:hypothetical protein